jgi:hypothetical protein
MQQALQVAQAGMAVPLAIGAVPGPMFRFGDEASGNKIDFNAGANRSEFRGIVDPVVERFVSPEMFAAPREERNLFEEHLPRLRRRVDLLTGSDQRLNGRKVHRAGKNCGREILSWHSHP